MEDILDSVRRVVKRWVDTVTPITSNVSIGDTVISVESTNRFSVGDEVSIQNAEEAEVSLIIEEIVDNQVLKLATPVMNNWLVSQNIVLRKLFQGMFVNGIYIGDPEVIPQYPAITVSGKDISSEWMTLDSTKERYNIQIAIYAEKDNYEDGYRFILQMANAIKKGLKRNIFILVNNFETTAITAEVLPNDQYIQVEDATVFATPLTTGSYPKLSDARIILENQWYSEETRVQRLISDTVIEISPVACRNYKLEHNPIAICPKKFIFNSWPATISIGTIDKKTLLHAAVINWFAEEEELVDFANNDPHLK